MASSTSSTQSQNSEKVVWPMCPRIVMARKSRMRSGSPTASAKVSLISSFLERKAVRSETAMLSHCDSSPVSSVYSTSRIESVIFTRLDMRDFTILRMARLWTLGIRGLMSSRAACTSPPSSAVSLSRRSTQYKVPMEPPTSTLRMAIGTSSSNFRTYSKRSDLTRGS